LLLSLPVLGRYSRAAKAASNAATAYTSAGDRLRAAAETIVYHTENQMVGVMALLVAADVLGLACWAWLAMAARRGHGWTRIAGSVVLAAYSICLLLVVFDTKNNNPGAEFTTLVVWALGVATVIPLWSHQAREFFSTWRKQ
jgi:hypothetical protein